MIQLPGEIVHMINTIEQAGFEAYAVGGCVRDSILGRDPEDWDLTSNASRDTLEALFPDAVIINKKLGVMRISEGKVIADIAAFRIDGEYKDYRRPDAVIFTEDLTEDLMRRDFTMNAIAINPSRGVVDPYCGISDIEKKLIRGIGDPRVRFEEDALRILRGIRFAAQLNFEIDRETLRAMKEKITLLTYISTERIREEFFKTILAQKAGSGLKLYIETGVLPYLLGAECIENRSAGEKENLNVLAERIDRTECALKFRLPLIYLCFEKQKAWNAIEILGYSNEMKKMLQQAVGFLEEFEQITERLPLKRFINQFGTEGYRYFAELSVQRNTVFPFEEKEVSEIQPGVADQRSFLAEHQKRVELFERIQANGEPVFMEDLAINGNDLKRLGICEGEAIGSVLKNLLDAVQKDPEKNEKSILLELASKGKK